LERCTEFPETLLKNWCSRKKLRFKEAFQECDTERLVKPLENALK